MIINDKAKMIIDIASPPSEYISYLNNQLMIVSFGCASCAEEKHCSLENIVSLMEEYIAYVNELKNIIEEIKE